MGVNDPERAFFWDTTTQSWRKAVYGEPGEYVWDTSTNSWVFGTIGAEYEWDQTTRSWIKGPGGKYVWNDSTQSWDKVTSSGYGGPEYWDNTTNTWVKNVDTAQNLALQSQTLNNGTWTKSRCSISADAIAAPDGTVTADKIVEDSTATSTHRVIQTITKAASAIQYTASVHFKAAERTFAHIRVASVGETNSAGVGINLSDGSLGSTYGTGFSGITAAPIALSNGWWRVTLTFTTDTDTNLFLFLHTATSSAVGGTSYTGNGASGIYAWGAQVRASASAGVYRPTTTAPA